MRVITRFRAVILSTLCILAMLANVNCGEYLLLHYLANPGWEPVLECAGDSGENASSNIAEEPAADSISTHSAATGMDVRTSCKDGDLNKDGEVDGLDIQFLVDCLLDQ